MTLVAQALRRLEAHPDASTWIVQPCQDVDGEWAIAVKSNIDVAGVTTVAGSKALENGEPAIADAPVVAGLRKAGAAVLATLNMNELAYGFTGRNEHFGRVPNPHDRDRLSGGSSSASAAIVAAGTVPAALGTDTNGSVRVPAALCGVWALRPTSGSVDNEGIVPLAPTLDVPGPLARDIAWLRRCAHAMGVPDELRVTPERAVIRVVDGFPADGVAPPLRAAVQRVASFLGARGHVELPWAPVARAAAQVLTATEAGAGHHRILRDRADHLEPLTRARLLAGLATDRDARRRCLAVRDGLRGDVTTRLGGADILLLPTVPVTAPSATTDHIAVGSRQEPINSALGRCTMPFSYLGLPALQVPFAEPDHDGLPCGVQLVGRPGDDALLLQLGAILEADGIGRATLANGPAGTTR